MSKQEKFPRLSVQLTHARDIGTCQGCGGPARQLWEEHDDNDKPEQILVALCDACSDRLIEPHPRLYRIVHEHEPRPGAMPVCSSCGWRKGLNCTHADLKANGGPGLPLNFPKPAVAMVDGTDKRGRRTGWRHVIWMGPVVCRRREHLADAGH